MMQEDSRYASVRIAAKLWRRMFLREQWFLHVDQYGADPMNPDMASGFDLVPPRDRFWADPFLWFKDGRRVVFVEELPYATNKGHITAIEFDDRGRVLSSKIALEAHSHLSYPFLFEWDSMLWMLPESGQSGRVTLYRCARFPDKWVAEKVLMDNVQTADPTLFEHRGLWWLFMTVAVEGRGIHERLCLYFGESPLGPFTPHPRNPVVHAARGARPAGVIFEQDGSLFRPAQDCSGLYGKRVVVKRIEVLTPDEFVESAYGCIEPCWRPDVLRTHHLSVKDGWRVVDALRHLRRWSSDQCG